jgi:hypothetical protein
MLIRYTREMVDVSGLKRRVAYEQVRMGKGGCGQDWISNSTPAGGNGQTDTNDLRGERKLLSYGLRRVL